MQIHNEWIETDSKYICEQLIVFSKQQIPSQENTPFENICLTVRNKRWTRRYTV
ncbi:hypothetical protein [Bacillus manliponensis]|uniref:hypothetical protein n=1 Tax=Bacillus manliponensis TaxID=574376 RepID=UPI000AB97491|nr:hypothetical protein [Bacillus manliponensis]